MLYMYMCIKTKQKNTMLSIKSKMHTTRHQKCYNKMSTLEVL